MTRRFADLPWLMHVGQGALFACVMSAVVFHVWGHGLLRGGGMAGVAATSSLLLFPWQGSQRRKHGVDHPAQERLQILASAEASLDAFLLLDAERNEGGAITDLCITFSNRHAAALLDDFAGGLTGRTLLEVMPQIRATGFFDLLCRVIDTGEPLLGEAQVRDPRVRASWLRYQVVRLGTGIAMTLGDISEMKASEQRYKELGEFTESIFESAPFSIFATDADGMITAMNRAAEELCGYSRTDLVGKAPLTLLHDRKELALRAREQKLRTDPSLEGFDVLTAKAMQGGLDEQEWTLLRAGGSRVPIHLAVRALRRETGDVTGFVGIAFDVTEHRAMMEYVTHLATHDQLTGLVGRAVLQDRIRQAVERARRYGTKVALFVLDLDHFKRINDSLGHWAGDQVLLETATRLRQAVRSTDTVARLGGDEFVLMLEDLTNLEDVEHCAHNVIKRLAPEMEIDQHQLQVTASIGVCVFPDIGTDVQHLLKWADAAMYSAKESGRNQFQLFRSEMLKNSEDRLAMERALRHAIERNELVLHYQPHVSLSTGAVIGMEALLRWQHPELGLLMPAHFIGLAEETGLILPLGEWAVRQACMEGKQLCDELGLDLTLSVNLSPRQFQQKDLTDTVERALLESGLPAQRLEVEITENTLMVNSAATLGKLQHLRELGVRIAIDDFGTGFCNFKYLLDYQVDRLKIDQQFVRQAAIDPNAAAVVRSIIAMSHGLNIRVVAEGVETEEQFRFLVRKRCDEAQGYFISRPVPGPEFAAAVRACGAVAALRTA